jgi:pilus assembly protein CpaB
VNPRQRRAILLLALATLGLLGVFVLVAGYVADVRGQVDPKVSVLVLSKAARANGAVTDDMVRTESVPRRWAPEHALTDRGELVNLVAGTDLASDTVLQQGMLETPPELAPGQREIAIMVDAETGVAGKIHPGSIVDIIATFAGSERLPDRSEVVVPGARIIDVGVAVPKGGDKVQDQQPDPQAAQQQVVPVTFALTPTQDLMVTHAETFASEVRLALLRPGDSPELTEKQRLYSAAP